ncbi:autotransporter domain-containing protein [Mesorhizobium sp. J8]|uniref:autotransporter domain-containing protein n=1 Tax=Mesorhizobium sp. J8 TaxID=2777475 RepID=UPI00191680BE|nr:autotransporter domain-containing protein [Mesorhizobium sp. J8]
MAADPANASSSQWTGAASTDWFDSANWLGGVPDSSASAVIDTSVPNAATVSAPDAKGYVIVVGNSGAGSLTIQNGGAVSDTYAYVGYGAGSTGTVTVDGAGSTWTSLGILAVGALGSGTLTVQNGGLVDVFATLVADLPGSDGTLNIGAASGQTAAAPGMLNTTSVIFGDGSGSVVFNHTAENYEFAPEISGTGAVMAEAGTTILTGVSDYTGPTIVDGGELRIDGSTASAATVNTGGTLSGGGSIGNSVTIDTGGTLSGRSGSTLKMGSLMMNAGSKLDAALGAPTATPLFDVSGDLSFYGVTLNITDAGDFGAGAYRLFDYGSTLTLANGGITVGATPPGTSNFTIQYFIGSRQINLLYLNGAEFSFWDGGDPALHHNGAVDGGSGVWRADGSNWTQVDGAVNGSYKPNPTFAVFQNVGGVVTVDASAGAIAVTGMQFAADGYRVEGDSIDLQGSGGSTTIRVGDGIVSGASYTATIASALTGGSQLVKNDFGTLILTGTSSYSGDTTVAAGKLVVDGSIASGLTRVNSGGTLGGSGAVGGATIDSGGTIAPGSGGIGTLSVQGNLTMSAGSHMAVDIDGIGASDLIAVSGSADITDAALGVSALGVRMGRYTIVTTGSGLAGTFGSVTGTVSSSAFLGVTGSYDTYNAYLDVQLTRDFADAGLTRNQKAAADGIQSLAGGDPLFTGNALYDAILALPTDVAARNAFDQLSGEVHTSAKTALVEDSQFTRDAAANRIRAAFAAVGASQAPVLAYADSANVGGAGAFASLDPGATAAIAVPATTDRLAIWGQGFGGWGNTGDDGNAARLSNSTGGFLFGGDASVLDTWRLGMMAGYSRTEFQVKDRSSSGASDNYHLGLYGGTSWNAPGGDLGFRAGMSYTWHDASTSRSVAFPDFNDSLKADYRAGTAQAFGELGYGFRSGNVGFEPFANLAYVNLHTDAFTEQGGAAALQSAATNTGVTFTTLGLHASTDFALGDTSATLRGMLGWRHAVGDTTPLSTFALAGGAPFAIAGAPIARDAAVVEAGLALNLTPAATLGVSYSGQFGSGHSDQSLRADFNWKF